MHKIVHLFFASRIRKQIRDLTGITLSACRFAYGNIKPDLTLSMYTTPHTLSRSQSVLKEHVEKLFDEPLHIADFSEKMGIVMHYLCDYFCFAHSDVYNKGLLAHLLYELRMIRTMLVFPAYNTTQQRNPPLDHNTANRCSAQNPLAFLQEHYKNYRLCLPSAHNDLCKALEISQTFCLEAIGCWCSLCFEPIENEVNWREADAVSVLG